MTPPGRAWSIGWSFVSPALGFALKLALTLSSFCSFCFHFFCDLIHFRLDTALNAEKRSSTREACWLVAADLRAELVLDAFPFAVEIVHELLLAGFVSAYDSVRLSRMGFAPLSACRGISRLRMMGFRREKCC